MWRKRRTLKLAIVVILVVFLLVILLPFADPDRERVTHFLPENMKAVPHDPVLRGRMAHTDGPVDVVKKRFEHRRALLDRACRLYRDSSLFKPRVTTKEDLTTLPLYPPIMNVTIRYCGIAKSASTTWEGFFAAIKNHMKSRDINPSEDRNQAEDEVYFTFVREPYARLWSAYVDKLLTPNVLFWRSTGRYIVGKFRKNPSEKSRRCGHDVTFPEFIRYVIDAQRTGPAPGRPLHPHPRPVQHVPPPVPIHRSPRDPGRGHALRHQGHPVPHRLQPVLRHRHHPAERQDGLHQKPQRARAALHGPGRGQPPPVEEVPDPRTDQQTRVLPLHGPGRAEGGERDAGKLPPGCPRGPAT
ncbi:uncharacterized protein LOC143301861 [Babylonia areolata]|uniref:uncharacterized protein LOC143301861 n=1 Tax=Babylonia areolata TaxID=304850 RepID=UPI003FD2D9FB